MMGGMLAPTANSASPLVTSSASMEPRQNFPQPQPAPTPTALPPNLLPVPVSLHPVTVADEPTNENISVKVKNSIFANGSVLVLRSIVCIMSEVVGFCRFLWQPWTSGRRIKKKLK